VRAKGGGAGQHSTGRNLHHTTLWIMMPTGHGGPPKASVASIAKFACFSMSGSGGHCRMVGPIRKKCGWAQGAALPRHSVGESDLEIDSEIRPKHDRSRNPGATRRKGVEQCHALINANCGTDNAHVHTCAICATAIPSVSYQAVVDQFHMHSTAQSCPTTTWCPGMVSTCETFRSPA